MDPLSSNRWILTFSGLKVSPPDSIFPKVLITAVMSGFIRSGKGEIFWRKTQQGLQGYPFCFDMLMNSKEWSKTFYAFKFFHSIFQVWLTQSIFRALKRDPDWAYLMIVWLQTFYAFKFFAKCFNFNLHNIIKGILQALGRDLVHLQTFW